MEIVIKITASLFIFIFPWLGKAYAQSLTLGMNATIALKSSSLELACRFSQLFVSNGIYITKDGQQVTICLAPTYRCGYYKAGYNCTSNQTGVFIIIENLSRESNGIWSCRYTDPTISLDTKSNSLNITVYTIPPGLVFTQEPNMNVDLSVTSAKLKCTTSGCTYPSPSIQWQGQSALSSYEAKTLNTTGTGDSCEQPEQFYTSTLDFLQNTTWSDNSDKILIFSCRIEYPDSTMSLIASGSHTISFAVRVTEAFLQYNNQNITSTLNVNSGEPVTLTCLTGTSRPAPDIEWYIGSRSMGSGTNLIFTPSDTENNTVIFCQAYNINPNLKVNSSKPSLFVRALPYPVVRDSPVGAVAGGVVAGGVVGGILVVIVIVVALVITRRTLKPKMKAVEREMDSTDGNNRKSKLTDNPVYDASNSRSGTGIVMVTHAEDPSKLYAQVVKTKTKKEKAKGKHGKTSRAASEGKHKKTSRGDIYENATQAVKTSAENAYENPGQLATGPSSGDNVYETPEVSVSKGQVYADVILGPPSTKGGKPIIHSLEDRIVYTDIDYGKRGKPLPECDEEKESSETKKKNGTKSSSDE